MPVNFQAENSESKYYPPYFEDVSSDKGFRGHYTEKSEDRLLADVSEALGLLNGAITSVRKGKWVDEKKCNRFIYEFKFYMPGPGGEGVAMGIIQVAAFPLRSWTEKKELQARKMALYVLVEMLETTFNFQRVTPREVATLIPFMLDNNGVTLSEAYLTGSINPGLLLRKGDEEEIVDGEVKP